MHEAVPRWRPEAKRVLMVRTTPERCQSIAFIRANSDLLITRQYPGGPEVACRRPSAPEGIWPRLRKSDMKDRSRRAQDTINAVMIDFVFVTAPISETCRAF